MRWNRRLRVDNGAPPLPLFGVHAARPSALSGPKGSPEQAGGPLGRWVAAWAATSQAPLAVLLHDAARATAQPEARSSQECPPQLLLGGSDSEAGWGDGMDGEYSEGEDMHDGSEGEYSDSGSGPGFHGPPGGRHERFY